MRRQALRGSLGRDALEVHGAAGGAGRWASLVAGTAGLRSRLRLSGPQSMCNSRINLK